MPKSNPPRIPRVEITCYPPMAAAKQKDFIPGDFILTHGRSVFSSLIRFGQGLRFQGVDRKYIRWNHAAIIVAEDGGLIEALGKGVTRTHISKYTPTEYHLVHLSEDLADGHDRRQMVEFANWSLGQEYGWLTIASITFSLIAGGKFAFGFDGQSICSGLVARALERTTVIFDRTPSHIMPADLAKYFRVEPPPRGAPIGSPPKRG